MSIKKTFEDYEVGQTFQSNGRTTTEADIRLFIGATGASHPAHIDHEYCADHPVIDQVVVQGLLSLSIADGFLAEAIGCQSEYALNYGHDKVRYLKPVYPGDTLRADMEIVDKREEDDEWGVLTVDLTLENQREEAVLVESQKVFIATEKHEAVEDR